MKRHLLHSAVIGFAFLALAGCPPNSLNPGPNSPNNNPNGGGSNTPPSAAVLAEEQRAHDLVNAQRTANGRTALIMNEDLREVARAHSEDMANRSFFEHENPDGDDPFERMTNAGISYNTAGENIALNQGFADPAATAVNGWMNSSGHRANILRTTFTHAGMGVAITPGGAYYFTQVFAGFSKDVPEGYVDVFYYGPYEDPIIEE